MTTVAYKNGLIAFDSRLTKDITLISDSYNKMIFRDGFYFFLIGAIAGFENLLDVFFEKKSPEEVHVSSNALVFDSENKKIFYIGVDWDSDPHYLWKEPVDLNISDAWGSGSDHALTAFDFGATAYGAIEYAGKRDVCTGGEIKVFDINACKIINQNEEQ
jgi:hypothetical protein